MIASPSSQRVWIEMVKEKQQQENAYSRPLHRGCGLKSISIISAVLYGNVALFTEGVD